MKPTVAEAKKALIEEAPTMEGLVPARLDVVRRHPKGMLLGAAALGVMIGLSPRLRRAAIDIAVGVARGLVR